MVFSWPTGLACHTARKFLVSRFPSGLLWPPPWAALRRAHFAGPPRAEGYGCVKTSKDHSRPDIVNKIMMLLLFWSGGRSRRESQRDRKQGGEGERKGENSYAILNIAACCAKAPKKKHQEVVLGQNASHVSQAARTGRGVMGARRCRSLPAGQGGRASPGKWLRYAPVFTPPPGLPLSRAMAWRRGHGGGDTSDSLLAKRTCRPHTSPLKNYWTRPRPGPIC